MMSDMRNNPKKTLGGFEVLAVRDYKEDTRKDLKTGEVTKTGLPASNVFIMNFLTMHGALCARPEQSLRSNSTMESKAPLCRMQRKNLKH